MSLIGRQFQDRPSIMGPGGLFQIEIERADGQSTVHRVRAKSEEVARHFAEKLIEPDVAESPRIVRIEKVE
jgi:hypothetical protein